MRRLRDAAVDGRLSHDSFVRRVDLALRAKYRRSLTGLVADLTPSAGFGEVSARAYERSASTSAEGVGHTQRCRYRTVAGPS